MSHSSKPGAMRGKTVLVTGATDGIGKATATALAALGARVVIHGRSAARCEASVADIKRTSANDDVSHVVADFASLAQVRAMAAEVQARCARLDVLINNAGVYMLQRQTTRDGFETMFEVNHLAQFTLTHMLLDLLQASAPARIVNVSSIAHTRGAIEFDNLNAERAFDPYRQYAATKLMNVLHANEIAARFAPDAIAANSLHPGSVTTKMLMTAFNMTGISVEQGAQTPIFLAASPDVDGVSGRYFQDCRETQPAPAAHDRALAQRLWQLSERLTEPAQ